MGKKMVLVIVVVIMLLLMTTPVSAVVKSPVAVKDALLKGIWSAIMDLQNQITALTKKVDNIKTTPMPEYRAGSYTTPPPPQDPGIFPDTQTVTFSHPMPNTNYRVSITNGDPSPMEITACDYCLFLIDSKTTTGFTFSFRPTTSSGNPVALYNNHKFDYIAIADN